MDDALDEMLYRYDPPIPTDPAELAWDMAVLGELVSRVDPLVLLEYCQPTSWSLLRGDGFIDWNRKFDAPLVDRLMGKAPAAAVDDMAAWYERNGWRF